MSLHLVPNFSDVLLANVAARMAESNATFIETSEASSFSSCRAFRPVTRGLDHLPRLKGDLSSSDHPQQIQFRGVSFSSGRKEHDVEFSAGTYDSTDGVGVVATTETYPSASRARAEMLKRIRNATKLIERERKTDTNRRFIGERVVLMEPGNSPGLASATVLWLQRQELSIIQSSSLETALKFEQQFYGK